MNENAAPEEAVAVDVDVVEERAGECMDCGRARRDTPLDVVVPDDQWTQITAGSLGGFLCVACILTRAAKLPGVRVAKLTFGAKYESRRERRARLRLERR